MKGVKIRFGFVAMPEEIWTQNIALTLGEFRLLGYLIFKTRYGKTPPLMSYDELMNGPWKDGKRADQGCGLSRNTLKQAIADLEKRGWVKFTDTSENPNLPKMETRLLIAEEEVSEIDPPSSDSDDGIPKASSESDDQSAVSSSDSDDHNNEVDKKQEKNRKEEKSIQPAAGSLSQNLSLHDQAEMIASAVIDELKVSNKWFRDAVTQQAEFELRDHPDAKDQIRDGMVKAWNAYARCAKEGKLRTPPMTPVNFFANGVWKTTSLWGLKKGMKGYA